jgi:hypothetical protein
MQRSSCLGQMPPGESKNTLEPQLHENKKTRSPQSGHLVTQSRVLQSDL